MMGKTIIRGSGTGAKDALLGETEILEELQAASVPFKRRDYYVGLFETRKKHLLYSHFYWGVKFRPRWDPAIKFNYWSKINGELRLVSCFKYRFFDRFPEREQAECMVERLGGGGFCDEFQIRRLTVAENLLGKYDICAAVGCAGSVFISPSLKMRLEQQGFSGFRFEPCLVQGQKYTEDEQRFGVANARVEAETPCYQWVVTSQSRGPYRMGNAQLRAIGCGWPWTQDRDMDTSFYLHPDDLAETDIQEVWYSENNQGQRDMHCSGMIPPTIISRRLMSFFINEKIAGWDNSNQRGTRLNRLAAEPRLLPYKLELRAVPVRAEPSPLKDRLHGPATEPPDPLAFLTDPRNRLCE